MKRIALCTIFALILSGCSVQNEATQPNEVTSTPPSFAPSESPSELEVQLILYFASDTGTSLRLFSERHAVAQSSSDIATDALSLLLSGIKPKDPDYVNLWGSGAKLNGLTVVDGFATVDLDFDQLNVGAEAELRAIEQILWTLKANNPKITQVEFLRNGNIVETFAGHVETLDVFVIDEGYQSLATVDLDLDEGDVFKSGSLITGLACTFEANVPWELFQDGQLVSSAAQTADLACPDRSKFEINLNPIEPGKYMIRVWESSMEDGSLINEDTKNFLVK